MPELYIGLLFEGFLRQERTCVVGTELGRSCPVTSLGGCVATSCFPLYCVSRLCLGASQIKVTVVAAETQKHFHQKWGHLRTGMMVWCFSG